MLTITVDGQPGSDIVADLIPEMIDLARRTGCTIRCKTNGETILAHSDDAIKDLEDAWNAPHVANLVFVRR